MDGLLIRSNAAKMISNFVMNVMDRKPDTTRKCEFIDMAKQSPEMQKYATIACQLGLMGLNGDGSVAERFDPTNLVTKAQFATILSRLIYGEKNNSTEECRYCKHVEALQAKKVITVTTDLMEPLKRGWAMLMLMRVTRL